MVVVPKSLFPTTSMPVSVYPADDLLLPERRRARRDLTPVPPTPMVSSAKERAASEPNAASGGHPKTPAPVPDMAEDRKNMDIPLRYSTKLCMDVLTYCCACCCALVHGGWVGRSVVGALYVLLP